MIFIYNIFDRILDYVVQVNCKIPQFDEFNQLFVGVIFPSLFNLRRNYASNDFSGWPRYQNATIDRSHHKGLLKIAGETLLERHLKNWPRAASMML